MKTLFSTTLSLILLLFSLAAQAKTLNIVAAENFYGETAELIGGSHVKVISIISNPNQDPHLFSASPSIARAITAADIIIYNGINYDPWIEKLLSVGQNKNVSILNIAELNHAKPGENPHLWYKPSVMPTYASALTALLKQKDPEHRNYYDQQLEKFKQSYQTVLNQISELHQKYANTPITATEPVFNYMAEAIGLRIHGQNFQMSIMNDIAPSATQVREFEDLLRNRKVNVLIYNKQVSNPVTERMQTIAKQMNIPIVGVSETQPEATHYIDWMKNELTTLEKALAQNHSS